MDWEWNTTSTATPAGNMQGAHSSLNFLIPPTKLEKNNINVLLKQSFLVTWRPLVTTKTMSGSRLVTANNRNQYHTVPVDCSWIVYKVTTNTQKSLSFFCIYFVGVSELGYRRSRQMTKMLSASDVGWGLVWFGLLIWWMRWSRRLGFLWSVVFQEVTICWGFPGGGYLRRLLH